MDNTTSNALTPIILETTTKGMAQAIVADSMTLVEQLATGLGFAPYSPKVGSIKAVSNTAVGDIRNVAGVELNQDMESQTNLDSMYFSGKV